MNGISPQHIPSFNLVCTMSSTAVSSRAASYKKGIDGDNSRRNREATTISIRKAKREEGMQKRRGNIINNFVADDPTAAAPASAGGESLAPLLTNLPALTAALGAGAASTSTSPEAETQGNKENKHSGLGPVWCSTHPKRIVPPLPS